MPCQPGLVPVPVPHKKPLCLLERPAPGAGRPPAWRHRLRLLSCLSLCQGGFFFFFPEVASLKHSEKPGDLSGALSGIKWSMSASPFLSFDVWGLWLFLRINVTFFSRTLPITTYPNPVQGLKMSPAPPKGHPGEDWGYLYVYGFSHTHSQCPHF